MFPVPLSVALVFGTQEVSVVYSTLLFRNCCLTRIIRILSRCTNFGRSGAYQRGPHSQISTVKVSRFAMMQNVCILNRGSRKLRSSSLPTPIELRLVGLQAPFYRVQFSKKRHYAMYLQFCFTSHLTNSGTATLPPSFVQPNVPR